MRKGIKNKIFDFVKNTELGLREFDLTFNIDKEDGEEDATIEYKQSEGIFKYILFQSPKDFDAFRCYATMFSPGFNVSSCFYDAYVQIDEGLERFQHWIDTELQKYIKEETETDLYEEYLKGVNLVGIDNINYQETDHFSIDQKAQIRMGFQEIKLIIAQNYATTNEQIQLINERIDYLIEAADRLNKTDWKGIFISTIIGMITSLCLDSEKGSQLFDLCIKILHIVPTLFEHSSK
ncbi:MAG: hypothetical protein JWR05_926 [Mucilaginibacter sp.]|nr:hypothetical protein [Mucilaginibacter sp.]